MIAKVCNRSGTRRANFGDVTAYIREQRKAIAICISPSLASAQTAAQEMALVAQQNTRARNPLYHYVLSWPAGDTIVHEQAFESVEYSLRKLGVTDDYQWIAAIHGDSQFSHVHVLVNRIHPRTYVQLVMGFDHTRLSRACRELEQRFSWTRGSGLATLDPVTGNYVKHREPTQALNSRAVDAEIWTGHTSFQRWLSSEPAAALRSAFSEPKSTWKTVHAALARFGLTYELHGNGATVVDRSGTRPLFAKATHLGAEFSLPALQARLGRYCASRSPHGVEHDRTYHAQRAAAKLQTAVVQEQGITALFTRYEAEVERWRTRDALKRRERWEEYRRQAAARAARHREIRMHVRDALQGPSVVPKRYLRAVTRELLAEEREMDRQTNRGERAAINALYKAPPSLFRVWLRTRAAAGNLDAAHALARFRTVSSTLDERLTPTLEHEQNGHETIVEALFGSIGRAGDFDRTAARVSLNMNLQARGEALGDELTARDLWRKQLEREQKREHDIVRQFRDDLLRCNDILHEAADLRAARSVIAMDTVLALLRLRRLIELERTMVGEILARIPSAVTDPAHIPDIRPPSFRTTDLSHRKGENGSVVYTLSASGQEFADAGTRLDFEKVDATTIRLGLLLAQQKWLDGITLNGTKAFQLVALREAVALNITITNPELQQLQTSLLKEHNQRAPEQRRLLGRREEHRFDQAPQASADPSMEAVYDAAQATAKTHGFTVDALREHTEYIEGTVRSAWSMLDKGFVVVTREDKTELVVTTIQRAHEAYDRMDERTSMNIERENLLEPPRAYAHEYDLGYTL